MTTAFEHGPRAGVSVLIFKEGKVLLGARKGSHGTGQYAGPGGHIEHGETMHETALREIQEECGIQVSDLQVICVSDLLTYLPKHYVDIGMTAHWVSGEPQVLEPHKLESWDWYDLDNLPENLFGCVPAYFESLKTGQRHFTFPAPN
jgi:8-oxo-dGTP diphosphatase